MIHSIISELFCICDSFHVLEVLVYFGSHCLNMNTLATLIRFNIMNTFPKLTHLYFLNTSQQVIRLSTLNIYTYLTRSTIMNSSHILTRMYILNISYYFGSFIIHE